jgi:hypothetical protein
VAQELYYVEESLLLFFIFNLIVYKLCGTSY